MKTTVKQRLIDFINFIEITPAEFQRKCGLSSGFVNNISKGIGTRALLKIESEYPQLNTRWLITGQGGMLNETEPRIPGVTQNNVLGNNNYVVGNNNTVGNEVCEVIEVECPKCGEVIEVQDAAVIPLIPAEVAKKPDLNLESWRHNYPQEMQEIDLRQIWGNGVFLMRVDTRAMEPEYREGTFLVLRKLPDISYARADGSAYVVDTMRPHTLFRYLSKERDGSYTLSAENDRRGPIYLKSEDILNIYDIVGSFRIGR